jgi:hypothetical protein
MISTANERMYALTVHSRLPGSGSRSRWMLGSATFTTVLSSMIMNSAKHIADSVHHLPVRRVRVMVSPLVLLLAW